MLLRTTAAVGVRSLRTSPRLRALALLLLLPISSTARAQPCGGAWLNGAGVPGLNQSPAGIAVLPSGDIVVTGSFTAAGSITANYIARYNPATATWHKLGSGLNDTGGSLLVLPDGDLIVSGSFTLAGGVEANRIARYCPSTGAWSALGSGFGLFGGPSGFLRLPSGEIIVAGYFSSAGGTPARNIARLDPETNTWSAMGSVLGPYTSSPISSMVLLPDGDVLVAGYLYEAGGIQSPGLARYRPSTNSWSAPALGADDVIYTMATLPSGDVLIAGRFATVGSLRTNSIARYNPNTDTWSALGTGVGNSVFPVASIFALCPLPNGEVLVGGNFGSAGGIPARGIARYNTLTDTWSAPTIGVNDGFGEVYKLVPMPDGDVIVGGNFYTAGGQPALHIARFRPASDSWSALSPGTNYGSRAVTVLPDGDAIVGGNFTSAGGVATGALARFSAATNTFVSLNAQSILAVQSLSTLANGDVIVAGAFTSVAGVPALRIARLDPTTTTWSALGPGIEGMDAFVSAQLVLPNGDLIIGGKFTAAGGVPATNIARFSPATNTWSALAGGVSNGTSVGYVTSIAVLPGGDIVAAGVFNNASGVPARNLARFNPSTATWSSFGDGPNGSVSALVVLPNGHLVAGGYFTSINGVAAKSLARWNSDTGVWSPMGTSDWSLVFALAVLPDGDLVVGGSFILGSIRGIARINPTTNQVSPLGAGANNSVEEFALLPNGDLLVAGSFTVAGGQVSAFFARYTFNNTCRADFNCSGGVTPQDIFDFLAAWFANSPRADFNANGSVTVEDVLAFLSAWYAACR